MAGGIGSRSSPIIIDDDDDHGPPPPRPRSNQNLPTKTPPQRSIQAGTVKTPTQDRPPSSARQEHPDQSKSGIGYSILVRMGYKPGYGLGLNLEGVTTPVKSRLWPQRSPAGFGTDNLTSSQNGLSRNAQDANPATASSQSIPAASQHVHETSSSSPSNATTVSSRLSSEPSSNQEHRPNPLSENASHDGSPSISFAHAGRTRRANTAKTPPSTPKHSDSSHTLIGPQEVTKTRSLDGHSTPASPNVQLPFLPIPSSSPLRLPPPPVESRASAPVNPPLASIDLPYRPVHPLPPPPTSTIPYVPKVKGRAAVLGMHLDAKTGGMRGIFLKDVKPPPNPSCSLIMEILPRKFRTQSFILDWLSQFSFQPSRYELVEGKVFFEFRAPRDALHAWNSPRMGGQEGLLGVRLFWYRVLLQTVSANTEAIPQVNATGTIENPAQPPQSVKVAATDRLVPEQHSRFIAELSQSHVPTDKLAPPNQPPVPSTISIEEINGVLVIPLAGDISSNSDNQTLRGTLSSENIFASSSTPPPTATSPLIAATPLNDPSYNGRAADCAMIADFPPGGVGPGFISAATISPNPNPNPPSPMSSSTFALSSSSTSPSLLPTFSPMVVDCQSPLLAPNQEPVQGPHLAAEAPHLETEVKCNESDRALPCTDDDLMETTDVMAIAKEQTLREMVLESRKRKLFQASRNQQPTCTTSSTATSGNALEDLAASFIADAIARPPPAKRVKITPSPSVMAAWGERLERHIASSKAIMMKIQSSQLKSEKDRLLAILREKNRLIDKEKMALFSHPVEDPPTPVSPWPESHPDEGILELSDTENEGDYDYDDDME